MSRHTKPIETAAGHRGTGTNKKNYRHLRPEYLRDFVAGVERYWRFAAFDIDEVSTTYHVARTASATAGQGVTELIIRNRPR